MPDWKPDLYNRFRDYRAAPFYWILERLPLAPDEIIADLGCGSGENTIELARRCPQGHVTGLDSSPAMLERAAELHRQLPAELAARINFLQGDFRVWEATRPYSILFSNAALQWADDHRGVLARWFRALIPNGRLVVQMPANHNETAQLTLSALACEPRWRDALGAVAVPSRRVGTPQEYSAMLATIGFERVDCYYHTFEHPMENPAAIVEFCRSTTLRPFLTRIPASQQPDFIGEFTRRLEDAYATTGALTFFFQRLFLWACRPKHN
jgi:trans-aconitate 2-methyltransferase